MNSIKTERQFRRAFAWCLGVFAIGVMLLPAHLCADEATIVKAEPAFWVVEGSQNKEQVEPKGKVYLLGSFHLLPKSYRWYDGKISEAFESSKEVVMEVNMTPDATAEVQIMTINNGFFRNEDNLRNHLDDAHYSKMLEYSEKYLRQKEPIAKRMKPWMMAISLSVVAIMTTGMDPNSGVDKVLQEKAKKMNIPISGLETVQKQMQALIDHPMDVQVSMLNETLDQLDEIKILMAVSLKAWRSGDEKLLVEKMVNDLKNYPGLYEALLVKRNKSWIADIEKHINSGRNVFIVVGAAHLVGPDGIVKTLKDLGYEVKRVQ